MCVIYRIYIHMYIDKNIDYNIFTEYPSIFPRIPSAVFAVAPSLQIWEEQQQSGPRRHGATAMGQN